MSYQTLLAMVSGKHAVWLYEFDRDGTKYRFTSHATDLDVLGATWTASAIAHGNIRRSNALNRIEHKVTFPQSDAFAQLHLDIAAQSKTTLITRRGFVNDSEDDYVVKYRGRVMAVTPSETTIVLSCQDDQSLFAAKGLSLYIQKPCNRAVYQPGCDVDVADFQTTVSVSAINNLVLTVADAALEDDGFYASGIAEYAGVQAMIASHVGDQVTLFRPLPGLETAVGVGATDVKLARGCNRTPTVCLNTFDNLRRYNGFPFIQDNVFGEGRALV